MTHSPLLLEEAIASIAAMAPPAGIAAEGSAAGYGEFEGLPVKIQLDLDGRTATLLEPISYTSAAGVVWPVPENAWLDGASIPQAFWSLIGGPYEGKYREPSIVHDHYCIIKSRPWQDTHRMFHTAMLCRGVSGFKARIMFYAVYRFGPRWSLGVMGEGAAPPRALPDEAAALSILEDAQIILRDNPDLAAIEAMADARNASFKAP